MSDPAPQASRSSPAPALPSLPQSTMRLTSSPTSFPASGLVPQASQPATVGVYDRAQLTAGTANIESPPSCHRNVLCL